MRSILSIVTILVLCSVVAAQCADGVCQLPTTSVTVAGPVRAATTAWQPGYLLPTARTVTVGPFQRSWGRTGYTVGHAHGSAGSTYVSSHGSSGSYGVHYYAVPRWTVSHGSSGSYGGCW